MPIIDFRAFFHRNPAPYQQQQSTSVTATDASIQRRLNRMAMPIIVSNATVPLLGAVDTAVLGHLPDPVYIGGVALGTVIYNYVHASLNFLRMGTTGPTAQAVGAGRGIGEGPGWGEVRNILLRAMLMAGLLGFAIILLQTFIVDAGLWALGGSAGVEEQTAKEREQKEERKVENTKKGGAMKYPKKRSTSFVIEKIAHPRDFFEDNLF